jgi:acetyl esterase/lipase
LLKNRIFRPRDTGGKPLPLYLDIHGGGWATADPETDDEFCSFLATHFQIIVVSISYRKAPRWKFTCALDDIVAIADAILCDDSLNIDTKRVAMGGFSAGGNLAFAACQDKILQGRVHALIGLYACLDFGETVEEKLSRRPKEAGPDILKSSANFLAYAYIPPGTNLRDPRLSPRWADKALLPSNVYLVGAEYDMLCHEAREMAEALAQPVFERRNIGGVEDCWSQGGVLWECARRKSHAFTHVKERGQKEKDRVQFVEEMYRRIGTWLKAEAWSELEE